MHEKELSPPLVDYFAHFSIDDTNSLRSLIATVDLQSRKAAPQVARAEEEAREAVRSRSTSQASALSAYVALRDKRDGEAMLARQHEDTVGKVAVHTSQTWTPHPITDFRYVPQLLSEWPIQQKRNTKKDEETEADHFDDARANLSMFCFPSDLGFNVPSILQNTGTSPHGSLSPVTSTVSLHQQPLDMSPECTWHSFVNTEASGVKTYGVAAIYYTRLDASLAEQLNEMSVAWRETHMSADDIEVYRHAHDSLALRKEKRDQLRTQLAMLNEQKLQKSFSSPNQVLSPLLSPELVVNIDSTPLESDDVIMALLDQSVIDRKQSAVNASSSVAVATSNDFSDIDEEIKSLHQQLVLMEEEISLYRGLLRRFHPAAFVDVQKEVWLPHGLVLTSHWPVCSLMRDCLAKWIEMTRPGQIGNIPIERFMTHLIQELMLPPPGRLQIQWTLDNVPMTLARAPLNQCPTVSNDSIYPLFRLLPIDLIVTLTEIVLNESKLLLISTQLSVLTLVCESLLSLIYPLTWQHVYVPVLPAKLAPYVDAPVPFILGMHMDTCDLTHIPHDVYVLHLDHARLFRCPPLALPLPVRLREKLLKRLKEAVKLPIMPDRTPEEVRVLFPKGRFVLTSMPDPEWISPALSSSQSFPNVTSTHPVNTASEPILAESSSPRSNASMRRASSSKAESMAFSDSPMQRRWTRMTSEMKKHFKREDGRPPLSPRQESQKQEGTKHSKPEETKPVMSRQDSVHSTQSKSISFSDRMQQWKQRTKSLAASIRPPISQYMTPNTFNGTNMPTVLAIEAPPLLHIMGHSLQPTRISSKLPHCSVCRLQTATAFLECTFCHQFIHESCQSLICRPCLQVFDVAAIRRAYLSLFTSLLQHYRNYLRVPTDNDGATLNWSTLDFFDATHFLESLDKEYKPFMMHLTETQMFSQFVFERANQSENSYEILYFDECIKSKWNRSKTRLTKAKTPFLEDERYLIHETIYLPGPNGDNPVGVAYDGFPRKLHPSKSLPPRSFPTLYSERDAMMMRMHTNAIRRKARLDESKRSRLRQELRQWVRQQFNVSSMSSTSPRQSRVVFDQRLQQVHDQLQWVLSQYGNAYEQMTVPQLRAIWGRLAEQQYKLMQVTDWECFATKSCQDDLNSLLKQIIAVVTRLETAIAFVEARVEECEQEIALNQAKLILNIS